jgi:hypothetical protein
MRRIFAAITATGLVSLAFAAPAQTAFAGQGNPSPTGTGLPSQNCEEIELAGGRVPGNSSASKGSPFNEAGLNTPEGGIGGQHYNETSQYDVACYHVSQH